MNYNKGLDIVAVWLFSELKYLRNQEKIISAVTAVLNTKSICKTNLNQIYD